MAKRKKSSNYFTKDTELAIIAYNKSTDPDDRARIFTESIHQPFYKLAENLIHTFKFYHTDVDNIEDLKHEIITVLLEEKIHKFDPSNGAKAFSYFGTIVKHWLINYSNRNYKRLKKRDSFDEYEEEGDLMDDPQMREVQTLSDFVDEYVECMYERLDEFFPKQEEKQIADAVLAVFVERKRLELIKKKALYIYFREQTECETPNLTKVIKVLKKHFYEMYQEKFERGVVE